MNGKANNLQQWIAKAENDLLSIENNLHAEKIPWDIVCFHAQQYVEKYLKAYLVNRGESPPHMHDLSALVNLCSRFDVSLKRWDDDCAELTQYAVLARYPGRFEPTREEALAMFEAAKRIVAAIKDCLSA
jgi:HEPN domain-containing protein